MKLNWNVLGGRGCKTKTFCGGNMDVFWNCTIGTKSDFVTNGQFLGCSSSKYLIKPYEFTNSFFHDTFQLST